MAPILLDDKNLSPHLRESLDQLHAEISVLPFLRNPSDLKHAPSDARLVPMRLATSVRVKRCFFISWRILYTKAFLLARLVTSS